MVRKATGKPRGRPSKDEGDRVKKIAISLPPIGVEWLDRIGELASDVGRSPTIFRLIEREARRLKLK